MIGTTLLNRYKVESELGKCGMGIVYKARDSLLHRAVAIKFLSTSGVGTEGKRRSRETVGSVTNRKGDHNGKTKT